MIGVLRSESRVFVPARPSVGYASRLQARGKKSSSEMSSSRQATRIEGEGEGGGGRARPLRCGTRRLLWPRGTRTRTPPFPGPPGPPPHRGSSGASEGGQRGRAPFGPGRAGAVGREGSGYDSESRGPGTSPAGGAPARPLRDLRAGPASAWGKGLGCADDSDARSCAARGPVQPRSGAAARIRIGPARAPRQGRDLFRARIPSHSFRIGCVWGGGEFCRTHPPPPPPPPCIGDKGPGAGRRSAKGPAPRAPSLNIRVTSLARQFSPLPQHASPLRAAGGPPPPAAVCRNRRDRAASQRKPSPPPRNRMPSTSPNRRRVTRKRSSRK